VQMMAAPDEQYREHISRTLQQWQKLKPRFTGVLARLFGQNADSAVETMLRYHDVGKLTRRWQDAISKGNSTPTHAALGAAAVWLQLEDAGEDLRNAAAFAVAIHHVDRGLVGHNIESPDVQAVLSGLVNDDGELRWHEDAWEAAAPFDLTRLTVETLHAMARDLRTWSRGTSFRQMHRRRLLASALHHILKVCDNRAAAQRRDFTEENEQSEFVKTLMEGGLVC